MTLTEDNIYYMVKTIVNIVLALISFFLLLRVFFLFFSVNQTTPFVLWVLTVSRILMSPFLGIAPNIGVQTGVLDTVALITLIAYLLVGYIILTLIEGLAEQRFLEKGGEVHYNSRHRG